eukprot:gene17245-23707_t
MAWVLFMGAVIIFCDWAQLGTLEMWSCEVICMDGLLLFDAPPSAPRALLAGVITWMLLQLSEEMLNFGPWAE